MPSSNDNELHELADLRTQLAVAEKKLATHVGVLGRMHQSYVYRLMRKFGLWDWVEVPEMFAPSQNGAARRRAPKGLNRIVVDLVSFLQSGCQDGVKTIALELVRLLGQMVPFCEFIVLTDAQIEDEIALQECGNIRCYRVDRLDGRSAANIITDLKADLLFCPFTLPRFHNPSFPVVTVVGDLVHVSYPEFFTKDEIEERNRGFRQSVGAGGRIICISEFVRRIVLESTTLSPEQVATIRPVLQPLRRHSNGGLRGELLRKFQLQRGKFLLYPADFLRHKNHEMLLTGFGIYKASSALSDLKLVLVGSLDDRQRFLVEAVRRMSLETGVVFAGSIAKDGMHELMESSFALIFPSLYEDFAMSLLEAMAAGTPLLSSDATSLPEIAGEAALYFDPRKPAEIANAILRLENEPALRTCLVEKGVERLAALGRPEEMVAQHMKVLHDALNYPIGQEQ